MKEISAHKLQGVELHDFPLFVITVIFPEKINFILFVCNNPVIWYGNTVGILTKVIYNLSRPGKRFLWVHNPVFLIKLCFQRTKSTWDINISINVKFMQLLNKLTAEDRREYLYRNKKLLTGINPFDRIFG